MLVRGGKMFRTVLVTVVCLSAAAIAGCRAGAEASRDAGLADSALDAADSDGGQGDADADGDGDADSDGDADADADADSGFDSGPDPCQDASPPDCVRYVNLNVPDEGDGLSWSSAFRTVQPGIDSAYNATKVDGGPEECEVWVARGIYQIFKNGRDDTIILQPGVLLLGGFAGNEPLRCKRNWRDNLTILDGHQEGVELDASLDYYRQVDHVITANDDSTIDGFEISGGFATDSGGGIIIHDANLLIRNTVFYYNYSYAIANKSGDVSIDSCDFVNNCGGILNTADAGMIIRNSNFEGNICCQYGTTPVTGSAGIQNEGLFDIENSIFQSNMGGAIGGYGNNQKISNCIFLYNWTEGGGAGAIYTTGGMEIVNATFYRNDMVATGPTPEYGAGAIAGGEAVIYNSIFWRNSPVDLWVDQGEEKFQTMNCLIENGVTSNGDFYEDPLFVDAPPISWPYKDAGMPDLHLQSGSPCIDRADDSKAPATDIEGHGRVDIPGVGTPGTKADVGAYEYRPKK